MQNRAWEYLGWNKDSLKQWYKTQWTNCIVWKINIRLYSWAYFCIFLILSCTCPCKRIQIQKQSWVATVAKLNHLHRCFVIIFIITCPDFTNGIIFWIPAAPTIKTAGAIYSCLFYVFYVLLQAIKRDTTIGLERKDYSHINIVYIIWHVV